MAFSRSIGSGRRRAIGGGPRCCIGGPGRAGLIGISPMPAIPRLQQQGSSARRRRRLADSSRGEVRSEAGGDGSRRRGCVSKAEAKQINP